MLKKVEFDWNFIVVQVRLGFGITGKMLKMALRNFGINVKKQKMGLEFQKIENRKSQSLS